MAPVSLRQRPRDHSRNTWKLLARISSLLCITVSGIIIIYIRVRNYDNLYPCQELLYSIFALIFYSSWRIFHFMSSSCQSLPMSSCANWTGVQLSTAYATYSICCKRFCYTCYITIFVIYNEPPIRDIFYCPFCGSNLTEREKVSLRVFTYTYFSSEYPWL